MNTLMLAAEAAITYSGDDWATLSYIMLGTLMLISAVTTLIVTPSADASDH